MSVIAAVSTIVGLDVLVLSLLAYVLNLPFRLAPEHASATAPAHAAPRPAVVHVGSRSHHDAHGLARTRRVSVATTD